jgi:hypothetical protein
VKIFLLIVWWISGSASFVYWNTKRSDLDVADIPFIVVSGVAGPINFPIGWLIYGDPIIKSNTVLFKKRQ